MIARRILNVVRKEWLVMTRSPSNLLFVLVVPLLSCASLEYRPRRAQRAFHLPADRPAPTVRHARSRRPGSATGLAPSSAARSIASPRPCLRS